MSMAGEVADWEAAVLPLGTSQATRHMPPNSSSAPPMATLNCAESPSGDSGNSGGGSGSDTCVCQHIP